jgi:hypothetical protein
MYKIVYSVMNVSCVITITTFLYPLCCLLPDESNFVVANEC